MISQNLDYSLKCAFSFASKFMHEYVTLEHLLLAFTEDEEIKSIFAEHSVSAPALRKKLSSFLKKSTAFGFCSDQDNRIKPTLGLQNAIQRARCNAEISGLYQISSINLLMEMFFEEDSYCPFFLHESNFSVIDIAAHIITSTKRQYIEKSLEEKQQNRSCQNVISEYCVNINELVLEGKIDKLIERTKEINRTIDILLRRSKNNPLYIGEPGVGKTAIAEGLAFKIVTGDVPEKLKSAQIYSLRIGALLAGTRYRGDFEERIKLLLSSISNSKNIILFIDEIHTIIGAGSTTGGSVDAGNLLKPFLTKGPLKCIGATTYKEYFTYFEKDAALNRRFQRIDIEEPSIKDTIKILNGIKDHYEEFHGVHYNLDSVKEIANLADRYITDRAFPDKAIDIMDDIGAICNRKNKVTDQKSKIKIDTKLVRSLFAKINGLPLDQLNSNIETKIKKLSTKLKSYIFDQDEVIDRVASALKIGLLGLKDKKPMGCYLFAGPTGVGKTELATILAKHLSMQLIRIDMSEYMESHSVSKLIGAPPGYVGYEKNGILTEMVSKDKNSIVLFDEIEKSHPDIQNILLQIMDYGCLTDSLGKKINFKNTVIIMTTNAGASEFGADGLGFANKSKEECSHNNQSGKFIKFFTKELMGRLDLVLKFNSLSVNSVRKIIDKTINQIGLKIKSAGANMVIEQDVFDHLIDFCGKKNFDARHIEKTVKDAIIPAVSRGFAKAKGKTLTIYLNKDKLLRCKSAAS